jgi:hypothetical protein
LRRSPMKARARMNDHFDSVNSQADSCLGLSPGGNYLGSARPKAAVSHYSWNISGL